MGKVLGREGRVATEGWRCRPTGEGRGSDEVADDFFGADHGAGGEGVFGAFGIDAVGDEAVFGGVDFVKEEVPEAVEFWFFEAAFEEGVLDADAEVFAEAGDAEEAFGGGDVVAEEGEHLFFARWGGGVGEEGEGFEEPRGHGWVGWLFLGGVAFPSG